MLTFLNLLLVDTPEELSFMDTLASALRSILIPILIVVATAGCIYAIYLGIVMAKAEDASKREEGRKRVINVVTAMVVTVSLILLMNLFSTQVQNGSWFNTGDAADINTISFSVIWSEDDSIILGNDNLTYSIEKSVDDQWVSGTYTSGRTGDIFKLTVTQHTNYTIENITAVNATAVSYTSNYVTFTLASSNVIVSISLTS